MNDRASDGCAPAGTKPLCPARTAPDGSSIALVRDEAGRQLLYVTGAIDAFHGEAAGGGLLCPTTPENATALADRFNWLKPQRIPEDRTSFGFGDRIGIAGPGHLKALRSSAVFPVLAQQSVRENARTGRTFADVLASAAFAAFREGYTDGFGADADHLKEIPDALEAAKLVAHQQ